METNGPVSRPRAAPSRNGSAIPCRHPDMGFVQRSRLMSNHRVAIVAGARTPFVKAGKAFAALGPSALAKHAVRGLLDRHKVDPEGIDAIAFGAVVPERHKPNLAREIVFEAGLPPHIEAQTVSSYCITGFRCGAVS